MSEWIQISDLEILSDSDLAGSTSGSIAIKDFDSMYRNSSITLTAFSNLAKTCRLFSVELTRTKQSSNVLTDDLSRDKFQR